MAKPKVKSQIALMRTIRGTWGSLNPVTRVIPNKKTRYIRHAKHRNRDIDF